MSDTKTLDDKLIKCIRCGFCLDACPTFRITGQETKSPRGRIYLVRSWRENIIPFDAGMVDAIDTCLGCLACETACPSGVDYSYILETARAEIEEKKMRPATQAFARAQMLDMLTQPGKLVFSLKAAGLFGKLTGGKMPGFAAKMLSGSADVSLPLPTPQGGTAKIHNLPEKSPAIGTKRATVGILAGCVMRVLFGNTNAATVRVLQKNGCEVIAPSSAACCGALHLHTGFHDESLSKIRTLIDAFAPHLPMLDAIIVNSAGCGSTMKEYGELLASDAQYRDKAAAFSAKVKDVCEFLSELGLVPPTKPLNATVTYHDACHLAHGQQVRLQPRQLLQQIPGLKLVELDEADTCCGSAGIYNITQPELAKQLLERKVANLRATGATVIATGNPGCLSWIQQGLQEQEQRQRVVHPVELLDEAYV